MKTCRACETTKELTEFYKKAGGMYGVTGSCRACISRRSMQCYYSNAPARRIKMREYRGKTIQKQRNADRARYAINPENRLSHVRRWRQENPDRVKESVRNYAKNNHEKILAIRASRQRRRKEATPKWLSKEQRRQILEIYKNRPVGYHVDHIEPLFGTSVCGLHVPWNLQYLPAIENLRKGRSR